MEKDKKTVYMKVSVDVVLDSELYEVAEKMCELYSHIFKEVFGDAETLIAKALEFGLNAHIVGNLKYLAEAAERQVNKSAEL